MFLLQLTRAEYVKNAFGFSFDDRWYFVLSTFLFAVVYRLLAVLATRYVPRSCSARSTGWLPMLCVCVVVGILIVGYEPHIHE